MDLTVPNHVTIPTCWTIPGNVTYTCTRCGEDFNAISHHDCTDGLVKRIKALEAAVAALEARDAC